MGSWARSRIMIHLSMFFRPTQGRKVVGGATGCVDKETMDMLAFLCMAGLIDKEIIDMLIFLGMVGLLSARERWRAIDLHLLIPVAGSDS